MTPKQAFGLVVRVAGLLFALIRIYYLICGFAVMVHPNYNMFIGIICLVVGLSLIRWAGLVARFAYSKDDSEDNPDSK